MSAGTRVRLNDRCVWPERRGCEGVIVAPPADGTYPQPAKFEVLVLLDDDPLYDAKRDAVFGPRGWTCVLDRKHVEQIVVDYRRPT